MRIWEFCWFISIAASFSFYSRIISFLSSTTYSLSIIFHIYTEIWLYGCITFISHKISRLLAERYAPIPKPDHNLLISSPAFSKLLDYRFSKHEVLTRAITRDLYLHHFSSEFISPLSTRSLSFRGCWELAQLLTVLLQAWLHWSIWLSWGGCIFLLYSILFVLIYSLPSWQGQAKDRFIWVKIQLPYREAF